MRWREFVRNIETRGVALVIFTGLIVAWVRHGLQNHWKPWDSWEGFFASWLVHTLGVVLLTLVTVITIIWSHKFFLGYDKKEYDREMTFYIVITILVAALGIAFVANSPPRDDYDDASLIISLLC